MVMAHGVERERAEPEGGQCCDSRWKFLFEETVFSAAFVNFVFVKSVRDIWKLFFSNLWDYLHKTMYRVLCCTLCVHTSVCVCRDSIWLMES